MANPLGINHHVKRGRPLADALRVELYANDKRMLKQLAAVVARLAVEGEQWAAQLVFERVDGRVPQPVGGSDELGPQRLQIEWKISDTNALAAQPSDAALATDAGVQLIECKPSAQVIDLTRELELAEPSS
jgi:hypothetical protein